MTTIPEADMHDRMQFAIFAIEAAAQKYGLNSSALYQRLKHLDLISQRLLADYELLHTQSKDYIADDLMETLQNWEAHYGVGNKKGGEA